MNVCLEIEESFGEKVVVFAVERSAGQEGQLVGVLARRRHTNSSLSTKYILNIKNILKVNQFDD